MENKRSIIALVAGLTLLPMAAQAADTCTPSRLLILLDRSSSMSEARSGLIDGYSKWVLASDAVFNIALDYEDKIDLGLMLFPNLTENQCGAGEINVPPEPDAAWDMLDYLAVDDPPYSGNYTPLGQSIKAAHEAAVMQDTSRNPALLVLTDGYQCCYQSGSSVCDASESELPVDEVKAAAAKGIKVYVVGFGTGVQPSVLSRMAVEGGTARPGCNPANNDCYYQVGNQAELDLALSAIAITVTTEVCDGVDNNCDGVVDEGLERTCQTACGEGIESCSAGEWVDCSAPQPRPDTGCGCTPGETRACGSDIGACKKGTQTCDANQVWQSTCAGSVPATAENCNGIDDDCNGVVDDPLAPGLCSGGLVCVNGLCVTPTDDTPPAPAEVAGPTGCGCRLGALASPGPWGGLLLVILLVPFILLVRKRN